jgi:hypothetical protein
MEDHEVRDPIHMFVRYSSGERSVIDCPPVQRLRHIHQLATTYLVYPGATHKRFEHSLGVMGLATQIFDVVTARAMSACSQLVPKSDLPYWRQVLRLAALLHDVGHLPFSHAAEKELLPQGESHETIGVRLIRSLESLFMELTPPVRALDVAKVAVGPEHLPDVSFTPWEEVLSEMITDDALGADRIDYLLRDSHHLGVAYGRFDVDRLVAEMRILPGAHQQSEQPALGLEEGGCHAAEALLLARYFMYTQVYFHHVRRSYDLLLKEFMQEHFERPLPTDGEPFLQITDNEVLKAIAEARRDSSVPGHEPAWRFCNRKHYRRLYAWNANDARLREDVAREVYQAACQKFGRENLRFESYEPKDPTIIFPVRMADGRIVAATSLSDVFGRVPPAKFEYVFVCPEYADSARSWLNKELANLLKPS